MLKAKLMNDINTDTDEPLSTTPPKESNGGTSHKKSLVDGLFRVFSRSKNGTDSLRDVIEEYIEDHNNNEEIETAVAQHEKTLISNILTLQDMTVVDVMIPRVDIVAIDVNSSEESVLEMLSERQFSRIPIYRDTMDEMLGTVHIKDILSCLATKKPINLKSLIREAPIVSPSLPVLDLMLLMQKNKKHLVFVVDEYGGIDGLVTVGDVIESIVGEIDDEFDQDIVPTLSQSTDGSIIADARFDLDDFAKQFGITLDDEEREENDTLGGLVFYTAGRIPARGKVIQHESGMSFEIVDADQRRINKLRIKNIPPIMAQLNTLKQACDKHS